METKLLPIKKAAKYFGIAENKMYSLVRNKECPFVELETLSGGIKTRIDTKTFAEWLNEKSRNQEVL